MLCESCGKNEARHRSTDIVNNVKSVRHLCEPCFKREGRDSPFTKFNLTGFIAIKTTPVPGLEGLAVPAMDPRRAAKGQAGKRCDFCGLDVETFRRKGAIGCPADYDLFAEEIGELLLKLHGSREHRGKLPKEFQNRRAREHQATQLESELERAVREERFEEAARLRDRIRALRKAEPDRPPVEGRPHDG